MAKLYKWQSTLMDEEGKPVKDALVQVRHELPELDCPLANLYADQEGKHPLINPTTVNDKAYVEFYVVQGSYKIHAANNYREREWRYVGIGLITEKKEE